METKTQYCEYRKDHATRLATTLMRSTCPRNPGICDYYKVKGLCDGCAADIKAKIEINGPMHCSTCMYEARVQTFWAILGSV